MVPGVLPWAGWAALYAAGAYARPGRRAGYVVMLGAFGLLAVIGLGALAYPTAVP